MNNPNGPYPGRQLFLGLTDRGNPCIAYLITGRSAESRERKAVKIDNIIRIGPIGNIPYDPLRHYSAVKYNHTNTIAAVCNGIQTEAIFEMYQLLFNTGSLPGIEYMETILDGAGAEPDGYHTPRIAGVITNHNEKAHPVFIIGVKGHGLPAKAFQIIPAHGTIIGISTYTGDMDKPESRSPDIALPQLEFKGKTAAELAEYIFDISAASYKGNDIRVCSIGGILSSEGIWELVVRNSHTT